MSDKWSKFDVEMLLLSIIKNRRKNVTDWRAVEADTGRSKEACRTKYSEVRPAKEPSFINAGDETKLSFHGDNIKIYD